MAVLSSHCAAHRIVLVAVGTPSLHHSCAFTSITPSPRDSLLAHFTLATIREHRMSPGGRKDAAYTRSSYLLALRLHTLCTRVPSLESLCTTVKSASPLLGKFRSASESSFELASFDRKGASEAASRSYPTPLMEDEEVSVSASIVLLSPRPPASYDAPGPSSTPASYEGRLAAAYAETSTVKDPTRFCQLYMKTSKVFTIFSFRLLISSYHHSDSTESVPYCRYSISLLSPVFSEFGQFFHKKNGFS